jgi:hypothetical protein
MDRYHKAIGSNAMSAEKGRGLLSIFGQQVEPRRLAADRKPHRSGKRQCMFDHMNSSSRPGKWWNRDNRGPHQPDKIPDKRALLMAKDTDALETPEKTLERHGKLVRFLIEKSHIRAIDG